MDIKTSNGNTLMKLADDASGEDLILIADEWYSLDQVYDSPELRRQFKDSMHLDKRRKTPPNPDKEERFAVFEQDRSKC